MNKRTPPIQAADEGCVEVQAEVAHIIHRAPPMTIDTTKLARARADVAAVAAACGWN